MHLFQGLVVDAGLHHRHPYHPGCGLRDGVHRDRIVIAAGRGVHQHTARKAHGIEHGQVVRDWRQGRVIAPGLQDRKLFKRAKDMRMRVPGPCGQRFSGCRDRTPARHGDGACCAHNYSGSEGPTGQKNGTENPFSLVRHTSRTGSPILSSSGSPSTILVIISGPSSSRT